MPIKVIRVDIFISSPSDLIEERKIIRRVIEKLNRSSLRDSYFLVPLLYEDEVPPEIGKEAQLIVDRYMQVKNSYILVSLFWARMGTPFTIIETKEKYESGTQYEILKGYENFQEKGLPHILLYKKEKENPGADPVQKEKVENFFNDFFGDPPKIKGLFAKYTDPSEFEAKVEEHLLKLIHTYPPRTAKDSLTEAPEFKEEIRRIDAAMPRETAIGEYTPVQVMICLPDSEGLKVLLPKEAEGKYEIEKRDVRAGGLTVAFPLDNKTGRLKPIFATIEIDASDFRIENNPKKIQLTPGLDSGQITFNLIPLYPRKYSMVVIRLKCNALDGGEIECGSVILYTIIKGTRMQLASRMIWDVVSRSLTISSLSNKVTETEIQAARMRKAVLSLDSHPIYFSVQAGPNGPVWAENAELGHAIVFGDVSILNKAYEVYSIKYHENYIPIIAGRSYGWVQVQGNSMNNANPIPINDGDYVLFYESVSAANNTIVIASLSEETGAGDKFIVKRYIREALISETTEWYPAIKISENIKILGIVVAVAKLKNENLSEDQVGYVE